MGFHPIHASVDSLAARFKGQERFVSAEPGMYKQKPAIFVRIQRGTFIDLDEWDGYKVVVWGGGA